MDKREIEIARAEQAHALRTNPLFEQAFDVTRQAILEEWAALKRPDSEHARDLHRMLECLSRVRSVIDNHVDTGKIAQRALVESGIAAQLWRRT